MAQAYAADNDSTPHVTLRGTEDARSLGVSLVTGAGVQSLQKHRKPEACMYRSFFGRTNHVISQAMLAAGRNYPELLKRLGCGHSPGVHQWVAGINAASICAEVSPELRTNLRKYLNDASCPRTLATAVRHCKCAVRFDEQYCKIQFCVVDKFDHKRAEDYFTEALQQAGFEEFEAQAPLEPQLQQAYLDIIQDTNFFSSGSSFM